MRSISTALAAGLGLALNWCGAQAGTAPPCIKPEPVCAEWLNIGSHAERAMIYRTYPLLAQNPGIRRALIMVHGALRNPDHYFRTANGAAFLAGTLGDTLVIAPAFGSADGECQDKLQPGEVNWRCEGVSWRSGGPAVNDPKLTSFDLMDAIFERLADKRVFPNLKVIVLAGHSAGGQFVSRYQMTNRVHESLGIPVSYVIANPSSYAWPSPERVLPAGDGTAAAAAEAWKDEAAHSGFSFGPFDAAKALGYDKWPYGLAGRTGYAAQEPDETLKRQLASRPATYLLSQVDVLPLGGFDDRPDAMAQGATRRQRGEAFVAFVNSRLGGRAKIMIVPECGHNDRCVFTTDSVLGVLFPKVD